MSREKQIDYITDLLVDFDEMGFAPTTTVPDPDAYAIEWRNKLTKALADFYKQSEWISVEDRLPEEKSYDRLLCDIESLEVVDVETEMVSDEVLVTVIDYEQEERVFVTTDCTINGQWATYYEVTHWMPFPEAPKMKGGAE